MNTPTAFAFLALSLPRTPFYGTLCIYVGFVLASRELCTSLYIDRFFPPISDRLDIDLESAVPLPRNVPFRRIADVLCEACVKTLFTRLGETFTLMFASLSALRPWRKFSVHTLFGHSLLPHVVGKSL